MYTGSIQKIRKKQNSEPWLATGAYFFPLGWLYDYIINYNVAIKNLLNAGQ